MSVRDHLPKVDGRANGFSVRTNKPSADATIAVCVSKASAFTQTITRTRIRLISRFRRVNEEIIVRLKWGQTEYTGRLVSVDSYMNIQLSGAEEWVNGKSAGTLGQVLIR